MSLLNHRIQKIHARLSQLYQSANATPSPPPDLLPVALVELGVASEALQIVIQELSQQNQKLASVQSGVELERQRYQDLLELVPDGYLVTDPSFRIQEANHAAASLFNTQQHLLVGKPLAALVADEDSSFFNAKLSQLSQRKRIELSIRFQRYHGDLFNAAVTVSLAHSQVTNAPVLLWLLRDVTEHKRAEFALECVDYDPSADRPLHIYNKGEIIPLEPNRIWLIGRGIVKLTTLSDRGEEMLVGLAREPMLFGPSLTALQIYQAIALSKVELVSISLTEIAQSPRLAQVLLPLISQRLRQAESFLPIYGQLRVEDRLSHVLELLKREIGQPVENGVRLQARLTHQDFASMCCTTRVTITRLIGKLQQEGKIAFDSCNHLILRE